MLGKPTGNILRSSDSFEEADMSNLLWLFQITFLNLGIMKLAKM